MIRHPSSLLFPADSTRPSVAISNGVNRVHVISYQVPDSLLLEVFTNEGTGTLVVDDIGALSSAEQTTTG